MLTYQQFKAAIFFDQLMGNEQDYINRAVLIFRGSHYMKMFNIWHAKYSDLAWTKQNFLNSTKISTSECHGYPGDKSPCCWGKALAGHAAQKDRGSCVCMHTVNCSMAGTSACYPLPQTATVQMHGNQKGIPCWNRKCIFNAAKSGSKFSFLHLPASPLIFAI